MKARILLVALLLISTTRLAADEAQTLFHQGNKLYDAEKYEQAARMYEQVIAAGKVNWEVYYNLGNAYFRLREIGEAILNYEKALKLDPDNEDAQFNLELANLSIVDRIPEPPKQTLVRWVEKAYSAPSFSLLLWLTLSLYALGILLFAARYFWPRITYQGGYRFLLWSIGLAFVFSLCVFVLRWQKLESAQYAIVMQPKLSVTSSPTENATEVFELHEGTKLKVEEQIGKWVRIRLRDGKVGWMPRQAIGII